MSSPGSDADSPTRNERAAAGRPRSEEAHRAILDAALQLLAEVGFSALTVEGVATRAGVGKATIYRRWSSKVPLVAEAFRELPALEDPETGNLEADLAEMLRRYVHNFTQTPMAGVVMSLAGERAHNPELSGVLDPLLTERRQPLLRILRRAIERGELPAHVDLELAADLVLGPMSTRFTFGPGLNEKVVPRLVRMAIAGMRHGSEPEPAPSGSASGGAG